MDPMELLQRMIMRDMMMGMPGLHNDFFRQLQMQDSDSDDEKEENVISSSMNAGEIEKVFASFEKVIQAAKQDRDKMVNERHDTPLKRYSMLLEQFAKISQVEPKGSDLTRREVSEFKERVAGFFLKEYRIGSETVDYFTLITDVFCALSKVLFSPSIGITKLQYALFVHTLIIFHNFTDCSPNFSRQVANNGNLMKTLLNVIKRFYDQHLKGILNDHFLNLMISATGVVYNIVRLSDSNNVMRVREFGFIEALKPLLESTRVGIRDHAVLILIFAASEDDAKKCCCDEPTINFLINKLKEALASPNHRSEGNCGYSDVELMEAIRKLAVIDDNKKTLAKLGCLQMMKKVLENSDDDEVVTLAFGILTQLAFDRTNAKWIDKELRNLLDSKFMRSSQPHREAASKLKWAVNAETEPQQTSRGGDNAAVRRCHSARAPAKTKHIMISYNHASKDFVKKLVQTLEKANLGKIWVDFNDMKGDLMDEMAFAVENAWVVLACVSLKYKDSGNCKMEAKYADKRGVPIIPLKVEKWDPDGWLGLMISSLEYNDYNFSKEDSNEEEMEKLLKALREKRGVKDNVDAPPIRPTSSQQTKAQPTSSGGFSEWSTYDVQIWCGKNGIPCDKCKELDGEQLQLLKETYQTAQGTFHSVVEKEFNFNLKENTAFVKAFNAL